MKKLIATAFAAGAMTIGGAASAQDFGSVIADIFGFGTPTYSHSAPAVVGGQIYADQYGRHFYYDQYGRQVFVQNTQQQQIVGYDSWGRPVYGNATQPQPAQRITGYDSWGRPIYGNAGVYAYGNNNNNWDRDGDGVANHRDRWPDDARYR
jgi:hypothetical protein